MSATAVPTTNSDLAPEVNDADIRTRDKIPRLFDSKYCVLNRPALHALKI